MSKSGFCVRWCCVLALGILPCIPTTTHAEIITNGGFEFPVLVANTWSSSPAGAVWNFTNAAILNVPDDYNPMGGYSDWNVMLGWSGHQVAILQTTSSFSQLVNLPESGVYSISWKHAGRTERVSAGGNQTYEVLLGTNVLGSFHTTTFQPFQPINFAFYANPATYTLTFQGKPTGGDNTAFIDDVSLTLIATNSTLPAIYTAVEIYWGTATNKNHQVQYADSPASTNWTNFGVPFPGTGSNTCFLDSTRLNGKRFYRIVTLE